jgi:protein SCO1/2
MTDIVSGVSPENEEVKKPAFKLAWIFYLILGLFLIGVIAFATLRPILVLPRITLGPGFALTDQDGNRLTNEDMRGKIALYNFTHTSCEEPCPQTSLVMKEVQDRLPEIETYGIPVELVTISVDPEHDTPQLLREYAAELGADTATWHFVTGPEEKLRWIIGGGFGFFFDTYDDGRVVFDPGFVLVDGLGILRAEYRSPTPDVERILEGMQLIAEEAEKSAGANKVAYEAAHLFMCYPRG